MNQLPPALAVAFTLSFGSIAAAERPPVSVSMGLGGHYDSGPDQIIPIKIKKDVTPNWTVRFGEDLVCSKHPYVYSELAVFVHGAHPVTDEVGRYNVGLHGIAGVGFDVEVSKHVGMFVEAAVISNVDRSYVAPLGSAGIRLRFGR